MLVREAADALWCTIKNTEARDVTLHFPLTHEESQGFTPVLVKSEGI